ncbi:MAG TPA: ATP-binding cassette domain-containing protein [Burkholderiaceae bacterium]|nr:ATP-binding cassette domain-containing protein [Burkholderiaceae bacterium]
MTEEPVLALERLSVALPDRSKKPLFGAPPLRTIVADVDLSVARGECVGVVGESGSGKSTLARAMVRLYEPAAGVVRFEGIDITHRPAAELRRVRERLQIVFQDSQSALNPRLSIGSQLAEPLLAYGRVRRAADARDRVMALLETVGLGPQHAKRYPHQLSGGQRQRIGIARAMALSPAAIVADEIVSGLDVSVQAHVLDLLDGLRRRERLSVVLISHDLSVVRTVCDRVAVMREGRIVECGPTAEVFERPRHPYTARLLSAIPLPVVDRDWIDALPAGEE